MLAAEKGEEESVSRTRLNSADAIVEKCRKFRWLDKRAILALQKQGFTGVRQEFSPAPVTICLAFWSRAFRTYALCRNPKISFMKSRRLCPLGTPRMYIVLNKVMGWKDHLPGSIHLNTNPTSEVIRRFLCRIVLPAAANNYQPHTALYPPRLPGPCMVSFTRLPKSFIMYGISRIVSPCGRRSHPRAPYRL